VRPPATSANLGPGFDAFGLALELRDEVVVEVSAQPGLLVEIDGEGAGEVPLDERHLIVRSLRVGFEALGGQPPGLRVSCRNRIPHGRGLGSSSAAICAGLVAARDLVEGGASVLDDETLLHLANRIEGHPDNVAPALRGGLTVAWTEHGTGPSGYIAGRQEAEAEKSSERQPRYIRAFALRLDPAAEIGAVAFVPPNRLATEVARGLLPETVPHRDAAFNAGRAGLLTAALTAPGLSLHHRAELLYAATCDRLHQDYRAAAMPESAALIRRLRADGVAAFVSGAGPTVLALTAGPDWQRKAADYVPRDWDVMVLSVAGTGSAGRYRQAGAHVPADTP
jgi:homoserine kinase